MTSPIDRIRIQQFELWFELLYWVAAAGCFALAHLPGVATNLVHIYALAVILGFSAVVWHHLLPKSWIGFRKTFYGAVAAIAFVTAFLHLTGGVESPFGPLYLLPILASFLVLDLLRAWVVFGLAIVGWGVLAFLDALQAPTQLSPLAVQVSTRVLAMTLAAAFTALFARQLHREILRERDTRQQLQESQAHLKDAAEQLADANEELQHISRVKDDFVAMVNHELRTPLTAMKQAIGLFLNGTLGPLTLEQREFMTVMARNLNRLTELITNLLDLSKIQAGKLALRIGPCRVEEIVDETLRVHQPLIGRRTIHVEMPPDLPPMLADRDRMIQVIGNLVSNAVKFTPEGGTITVGAQVSDDRMTIRIEDTGIGIAPEKKERLFQRFERLDADPSRPGTGLGLAICRELLELQQGSIHADSKPTGGTVFACEVPLAPAVEGAVVHG